ncbi:MAG: hypothetical protein ACYS8Y_05940, partial [Planctomycetota bacterium]
IPSIKQIPDNLFGAQAAGFNPGLHSDACGDHVRSRFVMYSSSKGSVFTIFFMSQPDLQS